jgi:hypothetical protein
VTDLTERLLEAHVQHELANWRQPAFCQTLAEQVSALFAWFADIKLDDVATREQIATVIERYVIELRVSGGITELTGEMSRVVFSSAATAATKLEQIMATTTFEEFADKLLSLEGVRRKLIALVAQSEAFATISARVVAHGVLELLSPPMAARGGVLFQGLAELLTKLGDDVLPSIERGLVELLGRYLERHRERMARDAQRHLLDVLDPEHVHSVIDQVWDSVSGMPLSEVFAYVSEQDIEDFVVLVYEFWLRYRKTEFFRRICGEMVDHFFAKYGQETLLTLIEDMGVDENMVRVELTSLLGPFFARAASSGFLEQQIRTRLAAFYRSATAGALLRADG